MKTNLKTLSLSAVSFAAAASAVTAAPSATARHAQELAKTGQNSAGAKAGQTLPPQVSLAPGSSTVLTTMGVIPGPKTSNILRVTFPLSYPARTDEGQAASNGASAPAVSAPAANPSTTIPKGGSGVVGAASSTRIVVSQPGVSIPVQMPPLAASTSTTTPVPSSSVAAKPSAPIVSSTNVAQPRTSARVADKLVADKPVMVASIPQPSTGRSDSRTPAMLGARHREMLDQLEAELQRSEKKLNRADADLTEGQRQLAGFTNVLNRAMLEAGPDAKGLHPFVKAAEHYAGTPYVWGGESRNGFDCSGFIIRVMRDLGYKALPHSAAEQFHYGLPVAQALLKPGDLVFFANTYKAGISHVGIYLGKRRFIHAAGTGIGTIVSSLDTPRFQAKYAGARRLVAGG